MNKILGIVYILVTNEELARKLASRRIIKNVSSSMYISLKKNPGLSDSEILAFLFLAFLFIFLKTFWPIYNLDLRSYGQLLSLFINKLEVHIEEIKKNITIYYKIG